MAGTKNDARSVACESFKSGLHSVDAFGTRDVKIDEASPIMLAIQGVMIAPPRIAIIKPAAPNLTAF